MYLYCIVVEPGASAIHICVPTIAYLLPGAIDIKSLCRVGEILHHHTFATSALRDIGAGQSSDLQTGVNLDRHCPRHLARPAASHHRSEVAASNSAPPTGSKLKLPSRTRFNFCQCERCDKKLLGPSSELMRESRSPWPPTRNFTGKARAACLA